MNIDIKNGLIFMVLAGVFTTTGYFGRDYIESNNKQKEFTFSIYKKFYDTSSAKIEKINKS